MATGPRLTDLCQWQKPKDGL